MRADLSLRQADRYPRHTPLVTRYRDLDTLGHVNNITLAGYYDDAREQMTRAVLADLPADQRGRIVTAQSTVTFLAELMHPSTITIATGLLRIGTASFDIGQAAFLDGACLGLCATTLVRAEADGSRPLSEPMRQRLEALMIRRD